MAVGSNTIENNLLLDSKEDLDRVGSVAEVVLTNVDCFLLDDLSLALLGAVWTESRALRASLAIAVASISSFFVKWLVSAGSAVLLDDEVRRSAEIGIASLHDLLVLGTDLIRVLADIA